VQHGALAIKFASWSYVLWLWYQAITS